jgi:hypothetical protein
MAESSLFAHLALRFGTDPETVATEALTYLLSRSAAARSGLLGVCSIAVRGIPHLLDIRARTADADGAPPVLDGLEADGSLRLVVFPKFWRGLGERQPIDDLQRLATDRTSMLVVVAPASRFTTLWAELRRRCRLAGLPVRGDHAVGDPARWTQVGPDQTLMLVSWNVALAGIQNSLTAADEESLARDAEQLATLCARLDSDAFLPLSADEMTAITPRRLGQCFEMVDRIADALVERGLGRGHRSPTEVDAGIFGGILHSGSFLFLIQLNVSLWATQRETPFWLRVSGVRPDATAAAERRLTSLSYEIPPRLLRDPATGALLVPLFPLLGAERDAVVDDLADQVDDVARLLGESSTLGFGSRRVEPVRVPDTVPDDLAMARVGDDDGATGETTGILDLETGDAPGTDVAPADRDAERPASG